MSKKIKASLSNIFILGYFSIILIPSWVISSQTQYIDFQQNTISIGLIETGQYSNIATRLKNLGFTVTLLSPSSGLNDFKNYNIVYLPFGWASAFQGNQSDIEAHALDYKFYVQQGGNLFVDPPDRWNYSSPILPYRLTIDNPFSWDDASEWPPIIVKSDHKITIGLSGYGMPGPENKITYTAPEYEILLKSRKTESPTLVVATYGVGRIVVHSADAFYVADHPINDRVYRRMLNWAAGVELDDTNIGATVINTIHLVGNPVCIDIQNNHLFIGKKDSLLIWDISDPLNIESISAIKLFNSLRFFKCYDHYVIIADSVCFALLDVADISNPFFTCQIALSSYGFLYDPEGLDVYDETAFVFGRSVTFSTMTEIFCISLANPSALSLFATLKVGSSGSFPYKKCGLYATPGQLFLAQDNSFRDNFEIFDKHNLLTPKKISGLTLDDLLPRYYEDDMNDLALSENIAFVVGNGGTANHIAAGLLAAIDITDLNQPLLTGNVLVPGNGLDLKLSGKFAIIAHGKGLSIIDVSNPAKMWIKDFLMCECPINRVALKDNYIYASSWTGGVVVVNTNINDEFPPNIDHAVITVIPPDLQGHVKIIGKTASVTDWTPPITATIINSSINQEVNTEVATNGGFTTQIIGTLNDELLIYAKDNNFPPNMTGSVQIPPIPIANLLPYSTLAIGGNAKDIEVIGNICCFALAENGLALVDIANPKTPKILSQVALNADVEDIKVVGRTVFAACNTGGVKVVSIDNPSLPTKVAETNIAGNAKAIDVQNNIVYTTISLVTSNHIYEILCIYKFDGSSVIKLDSLVYWDAYVSGTPPPPNESAIRIQGSYAFICDKAADFVVINVSNPSDPKKVKEIDLNAGFGKNRLHVQANKAFFIGDDIDVWDVTYPENPLFLTEWKFPGSSHDLMISHDYAIVSSTKGVGVFNINDLNYPVMVDYIGTPGDANKMFLRDSLIYLADGGAGLGILNSQTLAFDINRPPDPFDLFCPQDGDTVYHLFSELNWENKGDPDSGDEVNYVLYISENMEFSNCDSIINIPDNFYKFSNLKDHQYYFWKVKAVDIKGATTFSNQVFSFFTFAAPLPFNLISPVSGDSVKKNVFNFKWHSATDPNPADSITYTIYLDTTKSFEHAETISAILDTTCTLPVLTNNRHYYWTVVARDKDHFHVASPDTFDFWLAFSEPPAPFSLLIPSNGDTIFTIHPRFIWEPSIAQNLADSIRYSLFYSSDSAFTKADSIINIRADSIQLPSLLDHHTYFWRVAAVNRDELSTFSREVFHLFTFEAPARFKLLSPKNSSEISIDSLIFSWQPAFDPNPLDTIRYRFIISPDPSLSNPGIVDKIPDTQFRYSDTTITKTDYFWTIEAFDSDLNTTASSDTFKFLLIETAVIDPDKFALPKQFNLSQNYPNPFNPVTTITYQLPKDSDVYLKIVNMLGQEIAILVNEPKKAGYHSVQWDASSSSSGIYFVRMKAGEFSKVIKIMLIR